MKYFHELFDQCLTTWPEKVFLYSHTGNATFAELNQTVQKLEQEILSFGLAEGSRVIVVGENCKDYVAAILAISRTNNVFCGFNARQTGFELDQVIDSFGPQLVYFVEDQSDSAKQHASMLDAEQSKVANFKVLKFTNAKPAIDKTVAAAIFSSGTTGQPKGIMVSHRGMILGANSTVYHRRITHSDKLYACVPLTHSFGLSSILCAALLTGAGIIMRNKFDPADVFDSLANHGLTNLQGPPAMYAKLMSWLDQQGISHATCPSLKYLYTGTAPLTLALKKQVEERLGTSLNYGYAISEYPTSIAITSIDEPRTDLSVGKPTIDLELKILTKGKAAVAGEVGSIWIRGPARTPGYLDDPKLTQSVIDSEGWLDTGDLGYLDNQGQLFIVAREKEVIKHSGFSVYPAEIENLLNSLPTIDSAAVLGRANHIGDEDIIAFVKMKHGEAFNEQQLKQYLKECLAPYKQPAMIQQVDEFPLTVSNKIMKRKIIYDIQSHQTT